MITTTHSGLGMVSPREFIRAQARWPGGRSNGGNTTETVSSALQCAPRAGQFYAAVLTVCRA
jgi:hypothetical protein